MKLARGVLTVLGVMFVAYGVYIWLDPVRFANDVLVVATPYSGALMSEVHATYAGLQGVIGAVFLYIAWSKKAGLPSPVVACGWTAVFFAGIGVPRLIYALMATDGFAHEYVMQALVFEWLSLTVLAVAYFLGRQQS